MLRKVGNTWWGVSNLHQNWIFHHKYIYLGNIQSLEKTERTSKWSFLNHRAASLGDPRPRMGWWAGLLQDFQIPANFLPQLLQLHDPRPLRGEAQGCHQAALSGKLSLQARAWLYYSTISFDAWNCVPLFCLTYFQTSFKTPNSIIYYIETRRPTCKTLNLVWKVLPFTASHVCLQLSRLKGIMLRFDDPMLSRVLQFWHIPNIWR